MPQTLAKFGTKFWLICDSSTYYVLYTLPYVGKEDRSTVGRGEHVVLKLMEPYYKTGINVTTENYFTSLEVDKKLPKKN